MPVVSSSSNERFFIEGIAFKSLLFSDVRPLVTNINQPALIRSSVINDSNQPGNTPNGDNV